MYQAYYTSNQKQKKVDIFKFFKDEVNNVFDSNIFRYMYMYTADIYHMISEFL